MAYVTLLYVSTYHVVFRFGFPAFSNCFMSPALHTSTLFYISHIKRPLCLGPVFLAVLFQMCTVHSPVPSFSSTEYFLVSFPMISSFPPVIIFYQISIAKHVVTYVESLSWYFHIPLLVTIVFTCRYILLPRLNSTSPHCFVPHPRRPYIARAIPSPMPDIRPGHSQFPCFKLPSVYLIPTWQLFTVVFFHRPSHLHVSFTSTYPRSFTPVF